jgi:hypothetical protein
MNFSRRESLGLVAAAGTLFATGTAGAAAAVSSAPTKKKGVADFLNKIDITSPEFNRDTRARLNGDIQPDTEYVGWLKGVVQGVRPNEAVRDLFGFEGFSVTRMYRRPDGSWRKLLRETVMYRDLKTGEILKTWLNPYTNEEVTVVPIANDPYNQTIDKDFMGKPYLMDWHQNPDGNYTIFAGVNLFYPNALTPDKWVRESAGDFNQVTENFVYSVRKEDIENPNLTALPHVGSWQRITPWLPWMLMGTAEGTINYLSTFGGVPGGIDALPRDLVEATRAIDPKMLRAPTIEEDTLPNESSLEAYGKEQNPAPVPTGWTPPKPPAPPKFQGSKKDLGNQWAE